MTAMFNNNPAAGDEFTITMEIVNNVGVGVPTALTCTITSAERICQDTTNSVIVSAGAIIAFHVLETVDSSPPNDSGPGATKITVVASAT